MRIMTGRMAGLGLGIAGILVAVTLQAPAARAEEVVKSFTVSGHSKVRVQTDDGAVRVSTGDIKQVEVRVVYKGYTLDKDLRVTTSQSGDSVEVVAKTGNNWGMSWGVHHRELRVEVHMPKDARPGRDYRRRFRRSGFDHGQLGSAHGRWKCDASGREGRYPVAYRRWID